MQGCWYLKLVLLAWQAPALLPTVIGNYRVHSKKAGSGGLGVVYPAEHIPTGRPVALKLGNVIELEDGPQ